jgi:hypothetical protein
MSIKCLSVLTQNVKHFFIVLMLLGLMMILLFPQDTSAQSANKVVKVTGYGSNPNEARNDAVRQALQETMQQLIVVDRVIKDDQIIRDKIMSTMNGYVENFKELSIKKEGQQIAVQAEVTVSPSRIENFIGTSIGGGGSVSGTALFAESQRNITQRKVRGELFDRLFRGFPSEVLETTSVKMSPSDRDPTVYIMDIEMSFSKPWVYALKSMLKALSIGGGTLKSTGTRRERDRDPPMPPNSILFKLHENHATQYAILPPGDYGTLIRESLYRQEPITPARAGFAFKDDGSGKLVVMRSDYLGVLEDLAVVIQFIDERGLSVGINKKCILVAGKKIAIKPTPGETTYYDRGEVKFFLFALSQSYFRDKRVSDDPSSPSQLYWYLNIDPISLRIAIPENMINIAAAKNVALLLVLCIKGELIKDDIGRKFQNSYMCTDVLATEKVADICGEPMDRVVRSVMMQQNIK